MNTGNNKPKQICQLEKELNHTKEELMEAQKEVYYIESILSLT